MAQSNRSYGDPGLLYNWSLHVASQQRGGYSYYFCFKIFFMALFCFPGILLRHWISNPTGVRCKMEKYQHDYDSAEKQQIGISCLFEALY